jgi:hypothetical protein
MHANPKKPFANNCLVFLLMAMSAEAQLKLPWENKPPPKPDTAAANDVNEVAGSPEQAAAPDLGSKWTIAETEKGTTYTGTWVRRENSNTFDATWKFPNGKAVSMPTPDGRRTTTTEIVVESLTGDRIVLLRKSNKGRYHGTFSADRRHLSGTCTWSTGEWSAAIDEAPAPADAEPLAAPTDMDVAAAPPVAAQEPVAAAADPNNPAATKTPVRVRLETKHTNPAWRLPVGDVYANYEDGTKDRWTTRGNCMDPRLGPQSMAAWIVCEQKPDGSLDLYKGIPVGSKLRVFQRGKVLATIATAKPLIEQFKFETNGIHIVVKSRAMHGPAAIERCETAGGKVVQSVLAFDKNLPAWAKEFAENE